MSESTKITVAIFVAPVVLALTIAVLIFAVVSATVPMTWRTCQVSGGIGGGSVCLSDVADLNQIQKRPDSCLTDGHNVICGSYWQRQDRW